MNAPLRIAIADDERDMREYLCRILPRFGHEVVCVAANGRQLVDFCRDSPPDLVITDIRMPELDGIEASNAINALRPTPVILLSAFHDEDLVRRAADDHVAAYLLKPIRQAELKVAIERCVGCFERGRPVPGAEPAPNASPVDAANAAPATPTAHADVVLEVCENARAARETAHPEPARVAPQKKVECVKPIAD